LNLPHTQKHYRNSAQENYIQHMLQIWTSWAIVCDVWYLPPMQRKGEESAIDFANRVKRAIASKAGLEDLDWDGQLKRSKVHPKIVEEAREQYSHRLVGLMDTGERRAG